MMCDPNAVGVYVTEQPADSPVPTRVHVRAENVPVFVCVQVIVPVGVLVGWGEISAIATVQTEAWLRFTPAGLQMMLVVVCLLPTVMVKTPELVACDASPG